MCASDLQATQQYVYARHVPWQPTLPVLITYTNMFEGMKNIDLYVSQATASSDRELACSVIQESNVF